MHGLSKAVKHKMLQHLRNREKRTHGNPCHDINMDDVEEVVQEVGACVFVFVVGIRVCACMHSAVPVQSSRSNVVCALSHPSPPLDLPFTQSTDPSI